MVTSVLNRLNVTVSGTGEKNIMLAHGLGCDQTMWRFITPEFEKDHKVILFDFLGTGKSDVSSYDKNKYTSLEAYADDVLEIINALQLVDTIFIGHSVASMIGMLAAIKQPQLFKHIIMIGPSPCYLNLPGYTGGFERQEVDALLQKLKENLAEWSATFAPIIMGNKDRPALTQELEKSFASSNHEVLAHFAELTFRSDLRDKVKELKTPTLIMQCSDDIVAPEAVGKFMQENLPASKLLHMKATGHCAHFSQPAETIGIIKEYLEKN